jgi:septal ring factor EnvC (AmiA/AmiB activator)
VAQAIRVQVPFPAPKAGFALAQSPLFVAPNNSQIKNQKSKIKNQKSQIKNQKSQFLNLKSKISNLKSQLLLFRQLWYFKKKLKVMHRL